MPWLRRCQAVAVLLIFFACASPLSSYAVEALDYDESVDKSLQHAAEIKMARLDIKITQSDRKEALSAYYPTITARWTNEYVRDLTEGLEQVNSIGNTVLVQNTMYQSSFMVAAAYNLLDFGVSRSKVFMVDKDIDQKTTMYWQSVRDIKMNVLKTYAGLLTGFHELETKRELLSLYRELALAKERLYAAGEISKIEMTDEAVKTVKLLDDIDNLTLKQKALLEDLSFHTGERYEIENLRINDFKECGEDFSVRFDTEKSPEAIIYDLEITKKKAELQIIQRSLFPQIAAYSNYIWYGNHPTRIDAFAHEMQPRNFNVGISITLPLFEGFKSNAAMEKARLEVERLEVEKERKLAELTTRYAKLIETRKTCLNNIENQEEMVTKVEEKLTMAERLSDQKAIQWVDFLTQRIDAVNQKFDLKKALVSKIATIKELQLLSDTRGESTDGVD